jgi:hypothetical protein
MKFLNNVDDLWIGLAGMTVGLVGFMASAVGGGFISPEIFGMHWMPATVIIWSALFAVTPWVGAALGLLLADVVNPWISSNSELTEWDESDTAQNQTEMQEDK